VWVGEEGERCGLVGLEGVRDRGSWWSGWV
jgi:hypothetical protein